jgi:hypothetical protein
MLAASAGMFQPHAHIVGPYRRVSNVRSEEVVPAEKHVPHPSGPNMRDRLRSLGVFLETLWRFRDAMHQGRPLTDAFEVLDRLKASMIGVFGSFRIEATAVQIGSRLLGWRVTTCDRTTTLQHDFFVHDGQIHHLLFQSSPPWDHSSRYVVGSRVKRLAEDESGQSCRPSAT